MTLISISNSDGCVGSCTASCYNARGEVCDCICGGTNHGVGLQSAKENTRQEAERMIKTYAAKHGIQEYESYVSPERVQLSIDF